MSNDRLVGGGLFGGSVVGVIIYGLLLYYFPLAVLEVTAFVAAAVLLAILAWIGYTMATTTPPEPIADFPEPQGAPKPEAPKDLPP